MGRNNGSTTRTTTTPQASKRGRHLSSLGTHLGGEVDLMVRFTASRDRDRDGIGR